jgi:hypothetical protein
MHGAAGRYAHVNSRLGCKFRQQESGNQLSVVWSGVMCCMLTLIKAIGPSGIPQECFKIPEIMRKPPTTLNVGSPQFLQRVFFSRPNRCAVLLRYT